MTTSRSSGQSAPGRNAECVDGRLGASSAMRPLARVVLPAVTGMAAGGAILALALAFVDLGWVAAGVILACLSAAFAYRVMRTTWLLVLLFRCRPPREGP